MCDGSSMDTEEIIARLENVRRFGAQISARCPAHDDRMNSLSVTAGEDGRTLLRCHAGCSVEDITSALGLRTADLFPERNTEPEKMTREAEYFYSEDVKKIKWRRTDGKKSFSWQHRKGNSWAPGRGGPATHYTGMREPGKAVFLVEGEKDVDTLLSFGLPAVSLPDGADSRWLPEYDAFFSGGNVVILPDHDDAGYRYAQTCAKHLQGIAEVRCLDLASIWPEMPEHGDVSDYLEAYGEDGLRKLLDSIPKKEYRPPDPFLDSFRPLDEFAEQEATWLVPGWIPEEQITLIAADGGAGKTSLWVNIVAALSAGRRCILDPSGHTRSPEKVAFLTTEDSVRKKLRRKLREAGADLSRVMTMDLSSDMSGELRGFKFGSGKMLRFIREFRPKLCVFDPVQAFIPPEVNMSSRNAMRDCLAPLIALGEETGTTFLIVCHSNKRKGAWGRDRIADSADLWDISRSVIMCGTTEDGETRYCSQEKNNYDRLSETVLFRIRDEQIEYVGRTWKRDRELVQETALAVGKSKVSECSDWLLQYLYDHGGDCLTRDMEKAAKATGFTHITVRRAKDALKQDGSIRYVNTGSNQARVWRTVLKGGPVADRVSDRDSKMIK